MILLGQAVEYKWLPSDQPKAAIFIGITNTSVSQYRILYLDTDGVIKEKDAYLQDLHHVREPYEPSPSGERIYYGKHCTFAIARAKNYFLKLKEAQAAAELKKIKELITKS